MLHKIMNRVIIRWLSKMHGDVVLNLDVFIEI